MAKQEEAQRQENMEAGGKPCPLEKDGEPCDWILHPDWEMNTGKGFTYFVDARTSNRAFVHRHNLEGFSTSNKRKPKRTELGNLMIEAIGGGDRQPATEELILLAADVATGGKGTQQMQAIELLGGKLLAAWEKGSKHTPCPECARRGEKMQLNQEGYNYLLDLELEIIDG